MTKRAPVIYANLDFDQMCCVPIREWKHQHTRNSLKYSMKVRTLMNRSFKKQYA